MSEESADGMAGCDALSLKPMDLLSFTSRDAGPNRWAMSRSLVLVLIGWFLKLTWWLTGEYLSWRDSTELLSLLSQHPFVCLSLFALLLSSCHSLPASSVHAFLLRLVLTPAYPQVQGCRESMQSSVGWGMQSRQSCADSIPWACSFSCVPQLHWLSCTRTSSSFSFGTALSNRAMEMPADGVFLQISMSSIHKSGHIW